MIYKVIQPSLRLKDFIKDYLLLHFVFNKTVPSPVKPFPANTEQCLVFYLRGNVTAHDPKSGRSKIFAKTAINGTQICRLDFEISHHYLLLSINFQPDALSKFIRLPLSEFIDERIDAEAILNPEIHHVHERMANADSYDSIIQIAEEYLWKRIQSLKTDFQPIDKVTRLISENPGFFPLDKMAYYACLSVSQFERRFYQQLGITPKLFARISRFYKAYQIKDQNPNTTWLCIALETGYHDYQHLVKDFKQFSYTTPHSLIQAQAQSPERILGIG